MTTPTVPSRASLIARPEALDFLDTARTRAHAGMKPFEAYCRATGDSSQMLKWAFQLRDAISTRFGVERIGGFRNVKPGVVPNVGERLDFFTVEHSSDDQLVLTARDTHLSVMLSIDLLPADGGAQWVCITASVKTHNLFGKLYMVPVGPAHRIIVRNALRRVAAAMPPDRR
jgi:hypothetical protein